MISTIEILEQQVEALQNQSVSEQEHTKIINEIRELGMVSRMIKIERDTLSQVIRIFASRGKIDPSDEQQGKEKGNHG